MDSDNNIDENDSFDLQLGEASECVPEEEQSFCAEFEEQKERLRETVPEQVFETEEEVVEILEPKTSLNQLSQKDKSLSSSILSQGEQEKSKSIKIEMELPGVVTLSTGEVRKTTSNEKLSAENLAVDEEEIGKLSDKFVKSDKEKKEMEALLTQVAPKAKKNSDNLFNMIVLLSLLAVSIASYMIG